MPANVFVLYPPDAKFDYDYYMSTHMPLVEKHWNKFKLKSWVVNKAKSTADGGPATFGTMTMLTFESPADINAALGAAESGEVFGDIPNFSDKQPTILLSDVVGQS